MATDRPPGAAHRCPAAAAGPCRSGRNHSAGCTDPRRSGTSPPGPPSTRRCSGRPASSHTRMQALPAHQVLQLRILRAGPQPGLDQKGPLDRDLAVTGLKPQHPPPLRYHYHPPSLRSARPCPATALIPRVVCRTVGVGVGVVLDGPVGQGDRVRDQGGSDFAGLAQQPGRGQKVIWLNVVRPILAGVDNLVCGSLAVERLDDQAPANRSNLPLTSRTEPAVTEYRASFDAAVSFSNGGDLTVQGFRVDLPSPDADEAAIAALFVASLGLLMSRPGSSSETCTSSLNHTRERAEAPQISAWAQRPRPDGSSNSAISSEPA